jgi:hypothetical protein
MRTVRYSVLLILSIAVAPVIWAEDAPPASVEAEVDLAEITIGDQIHYKLTVDYANGVEIKKPDWGQGLEGFQILDFERGEPEKAGDRWKMVDTYTLSTFTPEDYTIPPLKVPITLPTGATQELTTQPIAIKVKSILPEDEKEFELRDLKSPIPVYSGILTGRVIAVAAGVLILLALVYGIWRWRHRSSSGPITVVPPKPEDEVALGRLSALKAMLDSLGEEPSQETCHAFGLELSEALREYLERRYAFGALEMTTGEIRAELPGRITRSQPFMQPKGPSMCGPIIEVLDHTDLLKFAKAVLSKTSLSDLLDRTISIVEATRVVAFIHSGQDEPHGDEEARREVA